ncbi:hypothetical protein D2A34_04585 [Clostridium chromiireducens]|uniref:Cadherin-like beta-sandwich-like domain-containing protein n=1 Tax=Clostridium chromiireducens TaxID=225345 RepID=A0A399IW22_9CLOT|nr:cadherin-like beta sandwich domain-containing protein [Clostridium chromiireducens]RII36667.1 hypothetical protein D2A34_04585 [Clostridium chromiireducens]
MNKKVKRITAIILTINVFSVIEPSKYIGFMSTKAYARITGADLEKISLGIGDIKFKEKQTEYTLQLASSVDELKIGAVPKETSSKVEINDEEVYESNKYKTVVKLDKGKNKITIKVENGSKKKTYTITVIRGQEEEIKPIYLSNISLSEGDITFSKDQMSYDIRVPYSTDEVSVKAIPEDDNYDLDINGVPINEDNKYRRTLSLEKGDNKIDIRVQSDDDRQKIYTLHINREETEIKNQNSSTTPFNDNNNNTVIKKGWVLNKGQWFYINERGNNEKGWLQVNGLWYYLDINGSMKTNWQNIGEEWYYFNSDGTMKVGWLKNTDGKWYYLYTSGIMAKNTIINGYKLDSNGAWIK